MLVGYEEYSFTTSETGFKILGNNNSFTVLFCLCFIPILLLFRKISNTCRDFIKHFNSNFDNMSDSLFILQASET